MKHTTANPSLRSTLPYLAPGLLLLILPMTHTVALRLLLLLITLVIAGVAYYKGDRTRPPCLTAWLLWLATALLSLITAVDTGYSAGEIKTEIGYGIIAFFAFFVISRSWRQFVILSAFQFAGFWILSSAALFDTLPDSKWSPEHFYGGVGDFSTYLITLLPITLLLAYRFFHRKPKLTLILAILTGGVLLIGALMTRNLMFWIALIAQLLAMLLFAIRDHGRIKLAVVLLAILLALGGLLTVGMQKHRITAFTPESIAAMVVGDVRVQHWNNVVQIISRQPFSGDGFGRAALSKAHPEVRTRGALWHSHNLLLDTAVQMGLQGVLSLALLLGCLAWRFNLARSNSDRDLHAIGTIGLVLLVGMLSKNMTDNFFCRHLSLLFWAETGMLLGLIHGLTIARTDSGQFSGQAESSPAGP